MRKPSLTDRIRRGARAFKRVSDELKGTPEEVTMRLHIDDDIKKNLKTYELEDVEAFIEWEARMFEWVASDEKDTKETGSTEPPSGA